MILRLIVSLNFTLTNFLTHKTRQIAMIFLLLFCMYARVVSLLQPRKGEFEIDSINAVEDTKGNTGERGAVSITNLRLVWCAHKDPRTNLSKFMNMGRTLFAYC